MNEKPETTVATLALLNLVRLLAAELVVGEHRIDVERLIRAIDQKLNATPLPRGTDVNDARAGIARARELLRPHVKQLRSQARAVRITGPTTSRPHKYLQ
jgi:hypothetical protein